MINDPQPMRFSIRTLTKDNQVRDFSWYINAIEDGLDVVSTIVSKGDQLLQIQLTEANAQLKLPPEIFDGQPFSEPMDQLRQQWEQILKQPLSVDAIYAIERKQWVARARDIHKRQKTILQTGQHQIHVLLLDTEARMMDGPRKTKLIQHYQRILANYSRSLANLELVG